MKSLHIVAACVVGATALTISAQQPEQPEQPEPPAQPAPEPQQPKQPQPKEEQGEAATERIPVIAADQLLDKKVKSSDGENLGEVEYLLFGFADGRVHHLVIKTDADRDQEMMAIPFAKVQSLLLDREIQLDSTAEELKRAPRMSKKQLATLSSPTVVRQLEAFWVSGAREPLGDPKEAKQAAPLLLMAQQTQQVLAPNVTTPQDLESMKVLSTQGKELGELKHVIIDLARGRVAYTLVKRAEKADKKHPYVQTPLQALEFTDQNSFQLKVPEATFTAIEGTEHEEVPRVISRSELQRIFEQFNVTPYWIAQEELTGT